MTDVYEVVITAGDPQGIGPEVAAKAAVTLCEKQPRVACVVVGDPNDLGCWLPASWDVASEDSVPGVRVLPVSHGALDDPAPSAAGGAAAFAALRAGFERVRVAPTACAIQVHDALPKRVGAQ